ncbi:uncharacterized protein [Venturia canescens]|uniref:uncharacterized protein n=1 Tax=Venturia canescens TaxID=32260 RepID=UPI001C9D0CAA|nr:uncharacterized protein LOC122406306 [Venturia canescens]
MAEKIVGLTCLGLLIFCWCNTTSSVYAASKGVRPRHPSRIATLNEYLTPPAPPNTQVLRSGISRHARNQPYHGGSPLSQIPQGSGPLSSPFRNGKMLTPLPTEAPGYFARLMGWFNPFGAPTTPRPLASHQPRPDNSQEQTFGSAHKQTSPPAKGHELHGTSYDQQPAPSYGPPTHSYHSHVSAEKLPRPPSPQGGQQAYLPPAKSRNCNPCNQVPWIPLYHGVNTEDARYAAGSVNVALPEVNDPLLGLKQDNEGTNIHHVSSFSQEVKIPDFGYELPLPRPVLDTNHHSSPSSVRLNVINNNNYNQNFHARIENRFPFTGPIPNPHLYPGAMPPLFKAKPFHSQAQSIDTSLDFLKTPVDSSFSRGGIENSHSGAANPAEFSFSPSMDPNAPLPETRDYQSNKEQSPNGEMDPIIGHSLEQQQSQNIETTFNAADDHQQSSFHHSEASLNTGYVDKLPLGAETVPTGSDDDYSFNSFNEDHGSANIDYKDTLNSTTDTEPLSGTRSHLFLNINSESVGQKEFQSIGTDSVNSQQTTNQGSQIFSDGEHVIHYELSPVIDLVSIGDDKRRKNSNDSSASSSILTDAFENAPVVLQNEDGTYGINATWTTHDSTRSVWPDGNVDEKNESTVTISSLLKGLSSENSPSSTNHNFEASGVGVASNAHKNQSDFAEYSTQSLPNNSSQQEQRIDDSGYKNLAGQQYNDNKQDENVDGVQHSFEEPSIIPESFEKQGQALPNLYPGLERFEDTQSYGFKLPDPPKGAPSDEPFLKALMKSYNNFNKKEVGQINDQVTDQLGNRQTWFDSSQIHPGLAFKPPPDQPQREHISGDGKLKSANRQHGAKKNKQVQIIIPYTSQYTPKPFHPLSDDWSAKTRPVQPQARKVPIYDSHHDYLAQEARQIEKEVSQILEPLKNISSRIKEVSRSPNGVKANTSIDVLRLQKNIDNWTIQEYSRGTIASTEAPKFSRPYLSPSKKIPNEYLTTTEPVVLSKNTLEKEEKKIKDILVGFSFNDLEHEGSASDQVGISHFQESSHTNEVSAVFPRIVETTTSTRVIPSTIKPDTWKELPVSISPLNKERVYVVTPQSVSTLSIARRNKSYDRPAGNETTTASINESDLDNFESIERAYQVLPQAVNNLVVASTGPATMPLWGIMGHEKYALDSNKTTPEVPILYAGHSKVSHAGN